MLEQARQRTDRFRRRLAEEGIDVAILTDETSIAWLADFWGYRTGRSIGVSYLEAPELKAGDRTILQPGMTFAVDGGISIDGELGGRIGDSIVVTETGSDYFTDYPREILIAGG